MVKITAPTQPRRAQQVASYPLPNPLVVGSVTWHPQPSPPPPESTAHEEKVRKETRIRDPMPHGLDPKEN